MTRLKIIFLLGGLLLLGFASVTVAKKGEKESNEPTLAGTPGLNDAVILIVRHAEKPDSGQGLAPEGEQRAAAYVHYFETYTIDGTPLRLDNLFAAADSKESHRPRLTIEPLSKALGIKIETPFADKQFAEMVKFLETKPHGRHILIAWHHGEIPNLVKALGADSDKLIPGDKWPSKVFGWVIQLRYDHDGHLLPDGAKRINEDLMPDDKDK
jgi:hypothetical protein